MTDDTTRIERIAKCWPPINPVVYYMPPVVVWTIKCEVSYD